MVTVRGTVPSGRNRPFVRTSTGNRDRPNVFNGKAPHLNRLRGVPLQFQPREQLGELLVDGVADFPRRLGDQAFGFLNQGFPFLNQGLPDLARVD
mgnify:CR=1 FL=1